MDTQSAIRYAVWYRLTQDEELKRLFGGQGTHLVWAPKDAPLLTLFTGSRTIGGRGRQKCRWYLDFWDYSANAERIYAIAGRAIELMECSVLGLVDSGSGYVWVCQAVQDAPRDLLVAARFYLQSDGDVPEDTDGIWHYASTWNVRFTLSPTQIERLINAKE